MNTTIKVPKIEDLKAAVKNSCDKHRHEWLMEHDAEYRENYEFHLNLAKSLPIADEIYKQIIDVCENCGYNPQFLECDDRNPIRLDLTLRYSDKDSEELIKRIDEGSNKIESRCKDDGYYASMKSDIFDKIIDTYEKAGYKFNITNYKFNLESFYWVVKFDPNIDSNELY